MHGNFLTVCRKLQQHEGLKLTQMIYCKKSFARILRQKGTQNGIFKFHVTNRWNEFFWFFVWGCNSIKETENVVKLFWENSIFGVLGGKKAPKWAQNEVFEVLWRTKVWQVSTFLWSYSTLRAWNCLKQLVHFLKNLV